jgi:hypothetical protein
MARRNRVDLGGIIMPKGTLPPTATAAQRIPEPEPRPVASASPQVEERMVALTIKVPASVYSKLRRFAVDHGRTHQDVGLSALRDYLDKPAS